MIKRLSSDEIALEKSQLKNLLKYCYEFGADLVMPESFYETKIEGLIQYSKEGKAFYFVVQEGDNIDGFIWACEINKNFRRVMHILYFAVLEKSQKKGFGKMLLNEVEKVALDLGIDTLELNVKASNSIALDFYKRQNFVDEHITMIKKINHN